MEGEPLSARPMPTERLRSSELFKGQDFYAIGLARDQDYCQRKAQAILKESDEQAKEKWIKLKELLTEARTPKGAEVVSSLKVLQGLCVEALGDAAEDVCQAAAIQLLAIFVDKLGSSLNSEDILKVKCSVAPISKEMLSRILEHVAFMKEAYGDIVASAVRQVTKTKEESNAFVNETKSLNFRLQSKAPTWLRKDFYFMPKKHTTNGNISFARIIESTNQQSGKPKPDPTKQDHVDANWLESKVSKFMTNLKGKHMTPKEVSDIILGRLESKAKDEVVSTDLFEMLGMNFFDLISEVMLHRKDIIKSATRSAIIDMQMEAVAKNNSARQNTSHPLGQVVTVKMQAGIKMEKIMAKEEKKLQKFKANNDVEDLTVDELRRIRQMELTQQYGAVSSGLNISRTTKVEMALPHVYDSMRQLKATKTFIAGSNVALPEGCATIVKDTHDEVTIPIKDHHPPKVCPIRAVKDLDEILQAAFPGTSDLNLIQSAVFPTAIDTNENMLICAPTGAGKTNIAMLAIMKEVMQHLDETTGKAKNTFKVVYVAPMKALASEMVSNFGRRLSRFGVVVKELTGDMQLTKMEMMRTHMLVTTPEKWDVVTRKSNGDMQLVLMVKLLILDEVHLLHGDRGPVLEALVARTLRQVESSQTMIRIVGLSATLPNYTDVAAFLRVNLQKGLFYFDHRFRPVPLAQTFIGVKARSRLDQQNQMNEVCFERALEVVKKGNQVMVFVHSRNATFRSAEALRDIASSEGKIDHFMMTKHVQYKLFEKQLQSSRNKALKEMFYCGFGMHHAGMLRQDRTFVEKAFSAGVISVLFCTSTLAWGVNLPANCVIIKGTDIYDSQQGTYVDLGILDVMQIFGRAGRPQFQQTGEAAIITHISKMSNYLSLMTNQWPIESNFHKNLVDNLIAEIVLGSVTNLDEAVEWLSYTYLFVRMKKNPLCYGITLKTLENDPGLFDYRRELVISAAKKLDLAKMIRYSEVTGSLDPTDLGRTASHFYVKYETVERINVFFEKKTVSMQDSDILSMISSAQEFDQLQLRDDEHDELTSMEKFCKLPVRQNTNGVKVNTLIQNYISRGGVDTFSLVSDSHYVVQNSTRITRALFDVALRKGLSLASSRLLLNAKMIERQTWYFDSPLRQFPAITNKTLQILEDKESTLEKLRDMSEQECGQLVHNMGQGRLVYHYAQNVPYIDIDVTVHPITRTVFKVSLKITPSFVWDDTFHHQSEAFWIWVEDPETDNITHYEYFIVTKKQVIEAETQNLCFTIPVTDPPPTQYLIHVDSDKWLGSEDEIPMTFSHLILPGRHLPHTELLDLLPLPKTALKNPAYESLYPRFTHFNPIQTQLFHTLYYTDHNVLLGAPTGSGKTITAEIAMFRVFNQGKRQKVVYIAPMKSLVKERINDWKDRLVNQLGLKIAELTGDVTPDFRTIAEADVIVTTPEKWDGVSRSWHTRRYVQDVALIVIDEIHLLGEDRGPVLEVIVSRANFIGTFTGRSVRVIGLSTALANARDLADWLKIGDIGLYNFKPSVRPVQLEVHVSGHPGKHYCPRMALMNKPAFKAIQQYGQEKPSLIFVSSRRQTRLTALDLIAFLAGQGNPRMWLHMEEHQMEQILSQIQDQHLRLTLSFGIGMHHAGLQEKDRHIVEELFTNTKIQVLIATATLAWGVNLPAHLVVVKGTEYFDAKVSRYVDYPITDVLQMIGRAGRPQFDTHGVAVVLVHDQKKKFYQKFLYEPFPVESSILRVLPDHLNAEIVAGTLTSTQDCMEYMTWTYFFRRLLQNPSYYDLEDTSADSVNTYLSRLIAASVDKLIHSFCINLEEDLRTLVPTALGKIASFYYLSHETAKFLHGALNKNCDLVKLMEYMCDCKEFAELPVRHNEDKENAELAKECRWGGHKRNYDSPHTKAFLLLQAHLAHCPMPSTDYFIDLKMVLDQAPRIVQAQIDILSARGHLSAVLSAVTLLQVMAQARYHDIDDPLVILPGIQREHLYLFHKAGVHSLAEAVHSVRNRDSMSKLQRSLATELQPDNVKSVLNACKDLPLLKSRLFLDGPGCHEVLLNTGPFQGKVPDKAWLKVHAGDEFLLSVELCRAGSSPTQRGVPRAVVQSRIMKSKDESWFLVLGAKEQGELVVMKRTAGFYHKMTHQMSFQVPETKGRLVLSLFVVSDAYLGLDQEYNLYLDVAPALQDDQ